ncbi:MAG TPA: flagellar protein FlaG [Deltaproteobacteria bacterium]|nr:flagellar protein FlaG [Deltaproteobacteria bacterium]HPJ92660.1 flagellar protein FlaG [Deltaproteobacteria bacterium]HPR55204.1 flagellar protein FlaG [Deltaproteobacteria bacterium]
MKIESISTVPVDPFRMEGAGVGSVVTTKASSNRDSEVVQAQKTLQKDTRSAEEIHKDIDAINTQLSAMNRSIQFSVDDSTHDIVVSVVDKESGEVIRQLPPESVLRLREHMSEISGLIVEENV